MNINTLLTGSARIDQMKKEISAITKMVFGFVADDDAVKALPGEFVLYQSDYSKLILCHDLRDGLRLKLYSLSNEEETLVCVVPGNEIPLRDVQLMHSHLDSFVDGMQKPFPSLSKKWRYLYHAARSGLRLFYELQFSIPSDDPLDSKECKKVRYKKKCSLPFPLPLNTEVFVSLEGEPTEYKMIGEHRVGVDGEANCFFKVVGYEHQMHDTYGDLEDAEFTMMLEPQEGWGYLSEPKTFTRLLEVNGWEDRN